MECSYFIIDLLLTQSLKFFLARLKKRNEPHVSPSQSLPKCRFLEIYAFLKNQSEFLIFCASCRRPWVTSCRGRAEAAVGCVRGHLCRPQLARCRPTLMIPTGCWDRLPRNRFPFVHKQRAQTHQASAGVGEVKATCGCASTYVSVQKCLNESPTAMWFLRACDQFCQGNLPALLLSDVLRGCVQ